MECYKFPHFVHNSLIPSSIVWLSFKFYCLLSFLERIKAPQSSSQFSHALIILPCILLSVGEFILPAREQMICDIPNCAQVGPSVVYSGKISGISSLQDIAVSYKLWHERDKSKSVSRSCPALLTAAELDSWHVWRPFRQLEGRRQKTSLAAFAWLCAISAQIILALGSRQPGCLM
jgi:hypothetical protein